MPEPVEKLMEFVGNKTRPTLSDADFTPPVKLEGFSLNNSSNFQLVVNGAVIFMAIQAVDGDYMINGHDEATDKTGIWRFHYDGRPLAGPGIAEPLGPQRMFIRPNGNVVIRVPGAPA